MNHGSASTASTGKSELLVSTRAPEDQQSQTMDPKSQGARFGGLGGSQETNGPRGFAVIFKDGGDQQGPPLTDQGVGHARCGLDSIREPHTPFALPPHSS